MPDATERALDEHLDGIAIAALRAVDDLDACGPEQPGMMRCHAKIVVEPHAADAGSAPRALGADDIRDAYSLPSSGGDGRIIAIVGAYDAPNAEADLAVYRNRFGLPPCTTANGCFTKVNQDGQTSPLPPANGGWAAEMALDLDMASATCPDCRLLLVEGRSPNIGDLGPAVVTAAKMGASAISNSYGSPEVDGLEATSRAWYDHPGVLVTASTGDAGYGVSYPASAPHVLAVGGTTLVRSGSTRGWAETAWRSGGSGCSKVIAKPPFQTDTGCPRRMNADVAAVADAATSVAVYNGGQWYAMGGTSASSPIVAGIFTLFNITQFGNAWPYEHATGFFDITSGSNGKCDGAYPCTAGPGYDGPTGMGTPNGESLAIEASKPHELVTGQEATPPPAVASEGCSVVRAPGTRGGEPRASWFAVALGSILASRRWRSSRAFERRKSYYRLGFASAIKPSARVPRQHR